MPILFWFFVRASDLRSGDGDGFFAVFFLLGDVFMGDGFMGDGFLVLLMCGDFLVLLMGDVFMRDVFMRGKFPLRKFPLREFLDILILIHNKIKVIARLLNEIYPDSDDEGVEETKESDTVDETPKKKRGRPSKRKPLVSGDGDEVAQT